MPAMKGFNLPSGSDLSVLIFGIIVLFLPVVFIEAKVLQYTSGVFMYPLDDTFIHLEIAKNLKAGVWGINDQFASASSSLLYTVMLTVFRVFSDSTLVPFVINCLAGVAIIWALHRWLKEQDVNAVAQALIILLAVFFTPLALLVVMGMEHTVQCLVSFLFIFYFSGWLEKSISNKESSLPWYILVFAALAASIRYEGLFLIAIAGVLLLYYKKLRPALLLVFVAALPIVLFGIYSISKGGYFLPNSVLVKSESLTYTGPAGFISQILFEKLTFARNGMAALATQRWLIILPLLYLIFRKYLRPSYSFILIFLMAATILQLSLASTGYLYRYEAYLFFCSILITAVLFYKYGIQLFKGLSAVATRIVVLVLAFFLFFPVVLRSITALDKTGQASKNIYDQQYQMARFSKKYYSNSAIAANDIGALSYFTDASIVDLWGLATNAVTKSKKDKYWTPQFLDSLCKANAVEVAIIYDSWFSDSLTSRWKKAATWQIQNNVICGDDVVSFYSLDSSKHSSLLQNLKEYQPQLPPSVVVRYY
jgi:hypothetical protein